MVVIPSDGLDGSGEGWVVRNIRDHLPANNHTSSVGEPFDVLLAGASHEPSSRRRLPARQRGSTSGGRAANPRLCSRPPPTPQLAINRSLNQVLEYQTPIKLS